MAMRFVPALTDSNREKERGQLCDRHPTLKFIGNLDTTTASEPESTLMAVLRGARNGAGLPRTGVWFFRRSARDPQGAQADERTTRYETHSCEQKYYGSFRHYRICRYPHH